MDLSEIREIVNNEHLGYVVKNYLTMSISHPQLIAKETQKFMSRWVLGKTEEAGNSLRFEQHSHSHFSDGAELKDIVDILFEKNIDIWSLTDHDNTKALTV